VLWRIEGFSSKNPIPTTLSAPTTSDTERLTRSAFAPITAGQYTRLLQFHTPGCGHQFYLRFKLYHNEHKNPVLAFGNAHSEIYFWDLARLLGYHKFMSEVKDTERDKTQPVSRPAWLQPIKHRKQGDPISKLKDGSDKDSVVSERTGSVNVEMLGDLSTTYSQETLEQWESRYDMTRLEDAVKAHSTSKITVKDFVGRQVAWSAEGDWCVVVGSKNLAIILQRWDKKDKNEDKDKKAGNPS
jgi:polycomb protein EED